MRLGKKFNNLDFVPLPYLADTHFLLGMGNTVDPSTGFRIPDEMDSYQPLGQYKNKTILLAIPEDKPDIFSIRSDNSHQNCI